MHWCATCNCVCSHCIRDQHLSPLKDDYCLRGELISEGPVLRSLGKSLMFSGGLSVHFKVSGHKQFGCEEHIVGVCQAQDHFNSRSVLHLIVVGLGLN